ncbi:peptide chain release factor 2 [Immundisolibacter sp.]|uniref:peptide chain release factor 2 n=1 Tax=Immundisolibacter sp. TaxID=1934948 RepID=UPI00263A05E3|nr:peptide chain release factor 2 [Immundisolibacter sp.]MDD3652421.1 peptide chain release factor 2 [Immundisolibacter sp.]
MIDINPQRHALKDLAARVDALRGYLDLDAKQERLTEVLRELEDPKVWDDPERAQELNRERARLEDVVGGLKEISQGIADGLELAELIELEDDQAAADALSTDVLRLEQQVQRLEFQRMFSGEADANNAYIDIQAGSGGTEAQDWAAMLLRMYLRWCERKGFEVEITEQSDGEVAGIKSATVHVRGPYAYGYLRTETGVHRLVRKSPFDSGNRRHTSFASVYVYPEVDENIEIDINPADLKVDTYRASGAGGQHVNRTESAIRITHVPTGIVVACQADRSQHKNRATAMSQLRAKLYERELNARRAEAQAAEEAKSDISWGHQIRSYVLDQSRIKDLRTGVETGNTQAVLDGDLDPFIEASLKSGL